MVSNQHGRGVDWIGLAAKRPLLLRHASVAPDVERDGNSHPEPSGKACNASQPTSPFDCCEPLIPACKAFRKSHASINLRGSVACPFAPAPILDPSAAGCPFGSGSKGVNRTS